MCAISCNDEIFNFVTLQGSVALDVTATPSTKRGSIKPCLGSMSFSCVFNMAVSLPIKPHSSLCFSLLRPLWGGEGHYETRRSALRGRL